MGSKEITVTQHRGLKAFNKLYEQSQNIGNDRIKELQDEQEDHNSIRIGEVMKFYPASDKVLVRFKNNKLERCIESHPVVSDEINFSWTPVGYNQFDTTYNEACITPISKFYAIVLDIRDYDNKEENCVIGYISKDNQTILNNAESGELKIQYYDTILRINQTGVHIEADNITLNNKPFTQSVKESIEQTSYTHEELTNELSNLQEQINTITVEENTTEEEDDTV